MEIEDKEIINTFETASDFKISNDGLRSMVIYHMHLAQKAYRAPHDSAHILMGVNHLAYKDMKLNITKVNYDKQMYKPCTLTVQMTMTGGSASNYAETLKTIFLKKECSVDFVTITKKGDFDAYFPIARYYYVKKLSLKYDAEGTAIATLTCYSPDNKLRKDKFCKVYTGKRFVNDVFNSAVSSLKNVFTKCSEPKNVRSASYYVNSNDLVFLGYKQAEKDDTKQSKSANTDTQELLQPYLLQYNESTYDFLCRVANRCGEFMFYDNGVLRIGLPEETHKALHLGNDSATLTATTAKKIKPTYTSYPEMSLDEDTGITTELFTENALESDKATSATANHHYYDAGYTNDEDLYKYKENKDNDVPTSLNPLSDECAIVEAYAGFASADSLAFAILNPMVAVGLKLFGSISILGFAFKQLGRTLADYENIYASLSKKDKCTALNDIYSNLCNFFYNEIEEKEKEISSKIIEMDFDNTLPDVFLGDAVTLEDGLDSNYIVTGIRGDYSISGYHHIVNAVPLMKKANMTDKDKKDSDASKNSEVLIAVPPYAVEHIIKGKPQTAIIRDTTDPLTMGRVRITYPWQVADNMDVTDTSEKDLSEGYSPWIRMSTPFAGDEANQGGMFMKPALGTHVIVNYFNDNMEDPYVEGSLYYKKNSAPGYKWEYSSILPQKAGEPSTPVRTIQSASGHGITFFDGEKCSFLAHHMIPPLALMSNMVSSDLIDCNNGGMMLSDQSGIYKIKMDATTRTIDINSPVGNVNINAFTGITISAPNGDVNIVGKNVNIKAGNNLSLQSGANISLPETTNTKGQTATWLAGKLATVGLESCLSLIMYDQLSAYGTNLQKLTDLSFLRSSWEVLMRPVEGTLTISTPRNIAMTAGKGKAYIPSYLMSEKKAGLLSGITGKQLQLATKDPNVMVRISKMLELARNAIYEYYNRNILKYKEVQTHIDKIHELLSSNDGDNAYKKALLDFGMDRSKIDAFGNVVETYTASDRAKKIKETLLDGNAIRSKQKLYESLEGADGLKRVMVFGIHIPSHQNINELKNEYNAALHAYRRVTGIKDADSTRKLIEHINEKLKYMKVFITSYLSVDSLHQEVHCIKSVSDDMYQENNLVGEIKMDAANCQNVCIDVFYQLIKQLKDYITYDEALVYNDDPANPIDTNQWLEFVGSLKAKPQEHTEWNSIFGEFFEDYDKATKRDQVAKLLNWNGCAGPRATSDVTSGGRILMSSSEGKTLMTNEEGSELVASTNPNLDTIKNYLKKVTIEEKLNDQSVDPGILWDPTTVIK